MSDYKMPEREPDDGAVNLIWMDFAGGKRKLFIEITGVGGFAVSPYNAWRLFGMMSVMLGLPLSRIVNKAIKL